MKEKRGLKSRLKGYKEILSMNIHKHPQLSSIKKMKIFSAHH